MFFDKAPSAVSERLVTDFIAKRPQTYNKMKIAISKQEDLGAYMSEFFNFVSDSGVDTDKYSFNEILGRLTNFIMSGGKIKSKVKRNG